MTAGSITGRRAGAGGIGGENGKYEALSASVSVSVSSPPFPILAGFPVRLKTRTDSKSLSDSAKWTFLIEGEAGADWALKWEM